MGRLLDRQDWARVRGLISASEPERERQVARLRAFCAQVISWNRTVSNLISKNDEGRIVERHLIESIEPSSWLLESGIDDWIDFGSGAGFPAIPLSVVGVGARWTLVESRRMKTLFLRKSLADLGFESGMTVVNARLESMPQRGDQYRGFTARAAGHIAETLHTAAQLVVPGGHAYLWKGSRWEVEIEADRSWAKSWELIEKRRLQTPTIILLKFLKSSD